MYLNGQQTHGEPSLRTTGGRGFDGLIYGRVNG